MKKLGTVAPYEQGYSLQEIATEVPETAITQGAPSLEGESAQLIASFEAGLAKSKPYLFNLASQLIEAYPERQWDVLVGDDTSGRLVARFARHALKAQGIVLPTAYMCASRAVRESLPEESYRAYVDRLADNLPATRRALVLSESAGSGSTLHFLDRQLSTRFDEVDFGVASIRHKNSVESAGNQYAGGRGRKPTAAIFETFEAPSAEKDRKQSAKTAIVGMMPLPVHRLVKSHTGSQQHRPSYPLTNLVKPEIMPGDTTQLPLAEAARNNEFRGVPAYCYARMAALAVEFSAQYVPQTVEAEEAATAPLSLLTPATAIS